MYIYHIWYIGFSVIYYCTEKHNLPQKLKIYKLYSKAQ